MKPGKETLQMMKKLCGELREDDGVDPRKVKKRENKQYIKRDRQLFVQVKRILDLALPVLLIRFGIDRCELLSVEPATDASRLYVVLAVERNDLPTARVALNQMKGALRTEVAQGIKRKKAPELYFDVIVGCEVSDE